MLFFSNDSADEQRRWVICAFACRIRREITFYMQSGVVDTEFQQYLRASHSNTRKRHSLWTLWNHNQWTRLVFGHNLPHLWHLWGHGGKKGKGFYLLCLLTQCLRLQQQVLNLIHNWVTFSNCSEFCSLNDSVDTKSLTALDLSFVSSSEPMLWLPMSQSCSKDYPSWTEIVTWIMLFVLMILNSRVTKNHHISVLQTRTKTITFFLSNNQLEIENSTELL